MISSTTYHSFLASLTAPQWQRIGLERRAGVATPLFSLYSKNSTGIGEYPDLKLLIEWCGRTGMSIIQLLPMNDTGFSFTPYDAQSTFALEPVYLSLEQISGVSTKSFQKEIEALKKNFPAGGKRVNYGVKKAKLELLKKMYEKNRPKVDPHFKETNHFWLHDYALFCVFKEEFQQASWTDWPELLRTRNLQALLQAEEKHRDKIEFVKWLQWQCFLQFSAVRKFAREKKVFLMGDLPFLVSKDSADVWANQHYFKLDRVSGAPPDAFFAKGQRWGMPPYNWQEIEIGSYDYLIEKVHYAQNFYDLFRIDHVVGTFRLWTIAQNEPFENGGLNGTFDPEDQNQWEGQGKKILSVMIQNADMLPCAEDLGVVPECSYRTLEAFAIPGLDVQRWTKDWETTADFKTPERYRKNSVVVLSNHDMSSFAGWWEFEAGTIDAELFERKCREKGIDFHAVRDTLFDLPKSSHGRLRWKESIADLDAFLRIIGRSAKDAWELAGMYRGTFDEKKKFWNHLGLPGEMQERASTALLKRAFEKAGETASIFSVQLLQEWLSLGDLIREDVWNFRINFPGTTSEHNWSLVMPLSLEEINRLSLNAQIKNLNHNAGRI